MICLQVTEEMDVCITVEAKVVFKEKPSGELEQELLRKDIQLRAEHTARGFEGEIAEKVKARLVKELSPISLLRKENKAP